MKKWLYSTSIIGIIISILVYGYHQHKTPQQPINTSQHELKTEQPECWINVFIHGTFNCLFAFFSLPSVINDEVNKTLYKSMINSKRKNDEFYQDQPMLDKGLIEVNPSYDIKTTQGKKYLAFPLAQAFIDFAEQCSQHPQEHHVYTFGWSGLLSQKQRRKEAIRLYNLLAEEIDRYHCLGKNPKIRLIAHSHGGNLCLNLATIKEILLAPKISYLEEKKDKCDHQDQSIFHMFAYMKTLKNQEGAYKNKKFKRYDYVPNTNITIDELIMLGTPIQVETINVVTSPIFKNVYSFYSEHDSIQNLDFISTKEKSNRKITITKDQLVFVKPIPNIFQGRLIINYHKKKRDKEFDKHYRIGHKELWGISWKHTRNPLSPLPISVISPMIVAAIQAQKVDNTDLDINIKLTKNFFKIQVSPWDKNQLKTTMHLPKDFFKKVQNNVCQWNPYKRGKAS